MPHPSETGRYIEEAPSSVTQVEQFITHVWEHPLVTNELRVFRQEALAIMQENMRANGVFAHQYAGIPAGGFLWAVEPGSDVDFQIIDYRTPDQKRHTPDSDPIENAEIAPIDAIHIVDVTSGMVDSLYDTKASAALFLTPDDYIVGNIKQVQKSRLELLEVIMKRGHEGQSWDEPSSQIHVTFETYFKQWGYRSDKRQDRFGKRVAERSSQAGDPEKWEARFRQELDSFSLPPFDVYKDALEQTNGALYINPRFKAIGIR